MLDLIVRTARGTGLVIGPLFLTVALGSLIHMNYFVKASTKCQGTVLGLAEKQNGDDHSTNFYPIFSFVAENGVPYTITSDIGTNPPEFHIGQTVAILYKASDPDIARIFSFWQLWTMPLAFGILGIVFGGVGYALLQYERWRDRRGLSITGYTAKHVASKGECS